MRRFLSCFLFLTLVLAPGSVAWSADVTTHIGLPTDNVEPSKQSPYVISPDPASGENRATTTAYIPAEGASAISKGTGTYKIQPYDSIHVRVWPYDELSIVAPVRPDGTVSYLFLGEIKVEGMTAGEVGDMIARSIAPYMKDPKVAVNLENFKSERAYILGKVMRPGQYDIRRGDTVFDLIGRAGGFVEGSKSWEVGLIKPPREGAASPAAIPGLTEIQGDPNLGTVLLLDLDKAVYKGKFPDEYSLQDGDIVFVPEKKKIDWLKIQRLISSFYYFFKLEPFSEGTWN